MDNRNVPRLSSERQERPRAGLGAKVIGLPRRGGAPDAAVEDSQRLELARERADGEAGADWARRWANAATEDERARLLDEAEETAWGDSFARASDAGRAFMLRDLQRRTQRELVGTQRNVVDEIASAVRLAGLDPRATSYTLVELLDAHVRARKARGRSEATLRQFEGLRKKLEQHLPRLAKDVTHQALLAYVETRRAEGAGERIRKELVFLRAALKLARKSKLFAEDPRDVIPELDSMAKPRTRSLTIDEARAIVQWFAKRSKAGADHAACFAWAVATGAEYASWNRAKPADVREDRRGSQVHGTKNEHRERFAPSFLPGQQELLAFAMKHARGKRGCLFRPWSQTNANRDLKAACAAVGIDACSTHDVRRTYADWWGDVGVRDSYLDVALGHKPASVLAKHYRRGRFEPEELLRLFAADVAAHAGERPLDGAAPIAKAPSAEAAGELRTSSGRPTDSPVDLRTGPIAQSVELRTFKPTGEGSEASADAVEPPSELPSALAFALREATRAAQWSVVAELARAVAARGER